VSLFTGLQSVNSWQGVVGEAKVSFNPLNAELNPIYHFLTLLVAYSILHVSGVRVNVQIVPNFSLRLKLVRAKLRPAGSSLTEEWQQRADVKDSKLNEGQGTD